MRLTFASCPKIGTSLGLCNSFQDEITDGPFTTPFSVSDLLGAPIGQKMRESLIVNFNERIKKEKTLIERLVLGLPLRSIFLLMEKQKSLKI